MAASGAGIYPTMVLVSLVPLQWPPSAVLTALGTCPAVCGHVIELGATRDHFSFTDTAHGAGDAEKVYKWHLAVSASCGSVELPNNPGLISLIWAFLCSLTAEGDRGICGHWDTMNQFWENKFSKEETVCGKGRCGMWGGSVNQRCASGNGSRGLCLKISPCCLSLLGPLPVFWFEGHL